MFQHITQSQYLYYLLSPLTIVPNSTQTTDLDARLSTSEGLTGELKVSLENALKQIQALNAADQGNRE